jgi:hypothetical protein
VDLEDFQEVAVLADLKKKKRLKEKEDRKNRRESKKLVLLVWDVKRRREVLKRLQSFQTLLQLLNVD